MLPKHGAKKNLFKNKTPHSNKMPTNTKEYMRQYYSDNKVKYQSVYVNPKMCAACQQVVTSRYWPRHVRTKKHLLNVEKAERQVEPLMLEIVRRFEEIKSLETAITSKNLGQSISPHGTSFQLQKGRSAQNDRASAEGARAKAQLCQPNQALQFDAETRAGGGADGTLGYHAKT